MPKASPDSRRDISNGLRSATSNLNHLGIERAPSKSTISYQNKHRDWRLFRDYYYQLLKSLGQQAGFKQVKFRIKSKILLLDSTTISLCLSLFDWAKYKTQKGAVKMHTLLDYDGNLPAYVLVSDGKTPDNRGAYDIPLLKNSVIVADRFYSDVIYHPGAFMSFQTLNVSGSCPGPAILKDAYVIRKTFVRFTNQ